MIISKPNGTLQYGTRFSKSLNAEDDQLPKSSIILHYQTPVLDRMSEMAGGFAQKLPHIEHFLSAFIDGELKLGPNQQPCFGGYWK